MPSSVPISIFPPLGLGVFVANRFFSYDCGLFGISKKVICLGIKNFRTLLQKHPGWGGSIHDKTGFPIMFSMEFPSQETSACGAFRRVTSSRDVPVPEPLPTRGSLMLVFGLQDAARAAQVLALLTSSRCRLRFECFPCGRPMSRRAFARRGRSMPGLPHKKGTTNP